MAASKRLPSHLRLPIRAGGRQRASGPVETMPLEQAGVWPALARRLAGVGCATVGDVARARREDILRLRFVGPRKLAALEEALADVGVTIGEKAA